MKKNLLHSATLAFGLFFLMTLLADLNGKWEGVIKTPDGNDLQVTFTFKVEGDKLTGTAEAAGSGALTIENGKVSGDNFSFTINAGGTDIPHSGKAYADSCILTIDFGGQKSNTTFMRVKGK